jgi:Fe-S-cluster-containing dehydrogenase component
MMKLRINPISGTEMKKKILIHLSAYRDTGDNNLTPPEAVPGEADRLCGMKTLRELAVFRFTCRKCSDAPCIAVCPVKALSKNPEGIIDRAINLCISCKSCVVICPFGTLMTDFFRFKHDKQALYEVSDENDLDAFVRDSPPGTVEITVVDESDEKQLFRLNDQVLIREQVWDSD